MGYAVIMVQLMLPETDAQLHLVYPNKPKMTPDEFFAFCQANPDLWLELSSDGEIIVMPPAGTAASFRSGEVFRRLANWAEEHGGGWATDASGGFALPDGSVRAPDAAWIDAKRLTGLDKAFRERYVPLAPDFVIEVMSPSDRLPEAQAKMRNWMANGVRLGWLIQPDARTVFIYRNAGDEPDTLREAISVVGDGPVAGFVLPLERVWHNLY